MSLRVVARRFARFAPLVVALSLPLARGAGSTGRDGGMQSKVEGYDIDSDALAQIRPG